MKDYYLILGIPRSATNAVVRHAYRELAKRYHPDRIGSGGAPEFSEISEAYHTLSDEVRREAYDRLLREGEPLRIERSVRPVSRGGPEPEPLIPERRPAPEPLTRETMSLRDFGTIRPSFDALFERLLRNFTHAGVPKSEHLEPLEVEVVLTADEIAAGAVVAIGLPMFEPCPTCAGTGHEPWAFPCDRCDATGRIEREAAIRVPIPRAIPDHGVVDVDLHDAGFENLWLRVQVRIAD